MTDVGLAGLAPCFLPRLRLGGATTRGDLAARMTSCPAAGRLFTLTEPAGTARPAPSRASQRRRS